MSTSEAGGREGGHEGIKKRCNLGKVKMVKAEMGQLGSRCAIAFPSPGMSRPEDTNPFISPERCSRSLKVTELVNGTARSTARVNLCSSDAISTPACH